MRARAPHPTATSEQEMTLIVTWRFTGASAESALGRVQEWIDGLLQIPGPAPIEVQALTPHRLPLRKWARS